MFQPRYIKWVWLVLGTLALGAAVHFELPVCPTAAVFGVPCPGCGLTRATLALLAGDWAKAFHFHPLVLPLAPFALFLVASAALKDFAPSLGLGAAARLNNIVPKRLGKLLGGVLLATMIGVWLARFAGFLGGPVATTTIAEWLAEHQPS
ncbi:MAG: DUF2752 domain-containing protein [Polyangiaceae bacterium]|nr:DUF2752 domain-containing protein [Polyangiaceae bacterium]